MEGESSLVPGYRLDRYELLCPIASGGMATVWLARLRGKRGFEKLFAVKTIKTELISDPHFQEMFLDEARIASRIIHPNVAQILELGEQDDILYLVMEFVDGDSVAKVHRYAVKCGSPLPPGAALRIIADTCGGLHAAHQLKDESGDLLGVVHRDVSPQNILLSSDGNAKVIDFGLVKAKNRSAGETKSGVVKGKIRYMAPEQVAGRSVDQRADVWAVGMCLYELITGHVPYHDLDELEVVKRLMSDEPLPKMDLALPPEIEAIILRATVVDPNGRYESCAAMRKAIEHAIHQLALPGESDDVAEFIRTTLPELADKRKKTIQKAIESAESRHPAAPESLQGDDVAYAKTEVSGRESQSPLPLTTRRKPDTHKEESSNYGAARTTSATRLMDDLGERKRRGSIGLWIAALVVAGVAAFLLWPRSEPVDSTTTQAAPGASSALEAAAPSSEPPPPVSAPIPSAIELEAEDAASPPPTSPSTVPTHLSFLPGPGAHHADAATPAPSFTGLSPGAQSAAKIMLAPKPSEDGGP